MSDKMTIGVAASAAGISPDAVRYYEKLMLLSRVPRTLSGYRVYESADVDRLRAIRRAQALGMSLKEIGALFPRGRTGPAECRRMRGLLAGKIAETDARIADLRRFARDLRAQLHACDRAIARGGEVPCPIFAVDAKFDGGKPRGRRT
jgi:DNA-binding transcriptional MerR regulator